MPNSKEVLENYEENINLKKILFLHLKNYLWYLLCAFLALIVASVYIYKAKNKYSIKSQIIINSKFQQLPQVDVLTDIASNMVSTVNNSIVDDQINILKSIDLVSTAVKKELKNTDKQKIDYKIKDVIANLSVVAMNNKNSFTVDVSLVDTDTAQGKRILEYLLASYKEKQKEFVIDQTLKNIAFIQQRVDSVEVDLREIECLISNYRNNNTLPFNTESASTFMSNISKNDSDMHKINLQQLELKDLLNFINKSNDNVLTVGTELNNAVINNLIQEYNSLIVSSINADKLSKYKLDNQIKSLKDKIVLNIKYLQSINEKKIKEYNEFTKEQSSYFINKDNQELGLAHLLRKKKTKEEIYLYLSKKLEEEKIKSVKDIPAFTEINKPYYSNAPIAPKKNIILLGSVIVGLLIPFSVIELRKLLDTTITDEKDFDKVYKGPYLGYIPRFNKTNNFHFEESLLKILSNLDYILPREKTDKIFFKNLECITKHNAEGEVYFVTSTIANEGKTFSSFHLARALSNIKTEKKVLLLGADVRSPKLIHYFDDFSRKGNSKKGKHKYALGLTDYIVKTETEFSDYVIKNPDDHKFDLVLSGSIPPNPAEILSRSRFEEFIISAKQKYDYIIVDTAPVGVLVDTLSIAKYADATIFLSRSKFLDKSLTPVIADFVENKRLANVCLLINDFDISDNYEYSYTYNNLYNNKNSFNLMKKLRRILYVNLFRR